MAQYHATYARRAAARRKKKEAEEVVARYAAKIGPQHRIGETKVFGGHTYTLNQHSRWERQDVQPPSRPGQYVPGRAGSPPRVGTQEEAIAAGTTGATDSSSWDKPESGGDHAARHEFTKQQLGSVQGPAKGVIAAMQAHPDIASGRDYLTKDFAPEQAGALHQWLSSNAGQSIGGGQVRDLGNGSFGFSSPAGAVVTQNFHGQFRVFYTNKTGLVAQAMGGNQPTSQAGATSPHPQQGSAVGLPPRTSASNRPSSSQPPAQQPATGIPAGQNPFAPPQNGERPQFAPGTGQNQLTPEAAAAAGALTAQPEKPAPAPRPSSPREAANQAKARLEEATHKWNEELAGGLSPKGNARWRSYTAALRSIHGQHEKLARDWEKQSKPSKSGGKGGASVSADTPQLSALTEHEQAAHESAPVAFKELQDMREGLGEAAYQDAVQQLAGQGKPWERRAAVGAPPQKSEQREQSGGKTPQKTEESHGSREPSREQEAMRRMGLSTTPSNPAEARAKIEARTAAAEAGAPTQPSGPPKFLSDWPSAPESRAKPKPSSKFETPPQEQPAKPAGNQRHAKLIGLADKYFEHFGVHASDKNKAAIAEAVKAGHVTNAKELRGVLNTAKGLLARGKVGDEGHQAVQEALRRKIARAGQERAPSWQATVKNKADEWDMQPQEFESLASDLHKEFVGHHAEREAARKAASKATGLTAGDINRLENQGYDSGSEHPKIKKLDEIGRDLESQYPALGWGRGREGDEGEEGVDYGEQLWDLIRTGAKRVPGRTSPEFLKHVEDYLSQQLRSAGSSRGGGGAAATDEDLKHIPFQKRHDAIVARYARWLQFSGCRFSGAAAAV